MRALGEETPCVPGVTTAEECFAPGQCGPAGVFAPPEVYWTQDEPRWGWALLGLALGAGAGWWLGSGMRVRTA